MAFSVPDLAVRVRRARAAHRRADDGDPPRQAPRGLREQPQRRARGHAELGGAVDRRGPDEPRARSPRTSARRSATTAAATRTTRSSGRSWGPDGGGEPSGALGDAIADAFGDFDAVQGRGQRRRRQALRHRLDVARRGTAPASPSSRTPNQDNPLMDGKTRRSSASTSGSTPTTSSTRTAAPTTSRRGGTSSTGTRSPRRFDAAAGRTAQDRRNPTRSRRRSNPHMATSLAIRIGQHSRNREPFDP